MALEINGPNILALILYILVSLIYGLDILLRGFTRETVFYRLNQRLKLDIISCRHIRPQERGIADWPADGFHGNLIGRDHIHLLSRFYLRGLEINMGVDYGHALVPETLETIKAAQEGDIGNQQVVRLVYLRAQAHRLIIHPDKGGHQGAHTGGAKIGK